MCNEVPSLLEVKQPGYATIDKRDITPVTKIGKYETVSQTPIHLMFVPIVHKLSYCLSHYQYFPFNFFLSLPSTATLVFTLSHYFTFMVQISWEMQNLNVPGNSSNTI